MKYLSDTETCLITGSLETVSMREDGRGLNWCAIFKQNTKRTKRHAPSESDQYWRNRRESLSNRTLAEATFYFP